MDWNQTATRAVVWPCELLDTQDGKSYFARTWPHYEEAMFNDGMMMAKIYMLHDHYCACHRKQDALSGGADTDCECEGERFLVKAVRPTGSQLILYSETQRPCRSVSLRS